MKTKTHTTPDRKLIISESFKAFLERHMNDNRVARLLHAAATQPHPAYGLFVTDALNYLTNRSDGTISYLPKGKECKYNADGLWARSARQEGKPSRVLNRLFSKSALRLFKESELTYFSSLYNAATFIASYAQIRMVKGADISEIYKHPNMACGSCMTNTNEDSNPFDIYTQNPDIVSMLVLIDPRGDDETIVARAIVWQIEGKTYLDRIYGKTPDHQNFLKTYAQEQGYIVKAHQSFSEKTLWQKPDGTQFEQCITIRLRTNFDHYPYLDTFTYGGDGWLSNDSSTNYIYQYDNTDGERDTMVMAIDGRRYPEGCCFFSDYSQGYIYSDYAVHIAGHGYFAEDDVEAMAMLKVNDEAVGKSEIEPSQVDYAEGYAITKGHRAGEFIATTPWRCLSRKF